MFYNYIDVIGNVRGPSRLQINPHIIQPPFDNFSPFYGFFAPSTSRRTLKPFNVSLFQRSSLENHLCVVPRTPLRVLRKIKGLKQLTINLMSHFLIA